MNNVRPDLITGFFISVFYTDEGPSLVVNYPRDTIPENAAMDFQAFFYPRNYTGDFSVFPLTCFEPLQTEESQLDLRKKQVWCIPVQFNDESRRNDDDDKFYRSRKFRMAVGFITSAGESNVVEELFCKCLITKLFKFFDELETQLKWVTQNHEENMKYLEESFFVDCYEQIRAHGKFETELEGSHWKFNFDCTEVINSSSIFEKMSVENEHIPLLNASRSVNESLLDRNSFTITVTGKVLRCLVDRQRQFEDVEKNGKRGSSEVDQLKEFNVIELAKAARVPLNLTKEIIRLLAYQEVLFVCEEVTWTDQYVARAEKIKELFDEGEETEWAAIIEEHFTVKESEDTPSLSRIKQFFLDFGSGKTVREAVKPEETCLREKQLIRFGCQNKLIQKVN